jgi:phosphatidyl-myo-inositol dimannoside synthase
MTTPSRVQVRQDDHPHTAERMLLLAPSNGLGGGIERFIQTLQDGFAELGVACHRIDLERAGVRAHVTMLTEARRLLRSDAKRTGLVIGHLALLPVAWALSRESAVAGISVLCHGSEVWGTGRRVRRSVERGLLKRPGIRAVAASGFTAGKLPAGCRATVLPPGLSREWFETLAAAGARAPLGAPEIRLVTAFRLSSWRDKGVAELIRAIDALGRRDVHLMICGSGEPPSGLCELVAAHPWCTLSAEVSDLELARRLAAADLFVLATRTRIGRQACGEGFGLVLIEAQVVGTPVIAPAYGGSSDAYVEGVTGLAPADESPEALTTLLREALDDRARLAAMGENAAEWARRAFVPECYARRAARRLLLRDPL